MAHTPTPICLGHTSKREYGGGYSGYESHIHVGEPSNRGNCCCIVYLGGAGATDNRQEAVEEFARYIVRAVNAFDPMRDALETLLESVEAWSVGADILIDTDKARAALALTETPGLSGVPINREPFDPNSCPDCREAMRRANSDATTPGFFFDRCDRHRGEVITFEPSGVDIRHARSVTITREVSIEEAKQIVERIEKSARENTDE